MGFTPQCKGKKEIPQAKNSFKLGTENREKVSLRTYNHNPDFIEGSKQAKPCNKTQLKFHSDSALAIT